MYLKTVYIIVLTAASLAHAWLINRPSEDKKDVAEMEYTCFPWIFNPGCPLTKWIDWDVVCRTNTLGWEMCDFKENSDKRKIEAKPSTKGEEVDDDDLLKAEDVMMINNVHVNNHSIVTPSEEAVLHELAEIESDKDEYTFIDHIVGNLVHGDKQESLNEQPQVIQLEDVVLTNSSFSSNSPINIVEEITGIVNASLEGFHDQFNQNSEVEFDFPSIFLESDSASSNEAHVIDETSTLKTAEEVSNEKPDQMSEEMLEKLVEEVFYDAHEEEELVKDPSDEEPDVNGSTAPEIFVIENLKPFNYIVNKPTALPALNLINTETNEEKPEIISLKPFRFVPIVKVIKHTDISEDLSNTLEENNIAEIQESGEKNVAHIINPRVSQNIF